MTLMTTPKASLESLSDKVLTPWKSHRRWAPGDKNQ